MTKKEQIYLDYLIAKLLGEKVQSVADKHECSRDWVHQIVRELSITDPHSLVRDYLSSKKEHTKRDKEIQVALIRDMFKNGFSMGEIAKYTGKSTNNVQVILYG